MNKNDIELMGHKLALLDYHHRAMDARRTIELRTFVGFVILNMAVAKGFADILDRFASLGLAKLLIICLAVALFLLFSGAISQIEMTNKYDRIKYSEVRDNIYDELSSRVVAPLRPWQDVRTARESFRASVGASWAGTWSVAAAFLLTVSMCVFVLLLRPTTTTTAAVSPTTQMPASQAPVLP